MDSEELYDMIHRNSMGVINQLKNRIPTIRSYKIKIGTVGGVWQNYDLSVDNIDKCFIEDPISVRIHINSWNFLAFIFTYSHTLKQFYIAQGVDISEVGSRFLNNGEDIAGFTGTNSYTIEEVNKIEILDNLINKI